MPVNSTNQARGSSSGYSPSRHSFSPPAQIEITDGYALEVDDFLGFPNLESVRPRFDVGRAKGEAPLCVSAGHDLASVHDEGDRCVGGSHPGDALLAARDFTHRHSAKGAVEVGLDTVVIQSQVFQMDVHAHSLSLTNFLRATLTHDDGILTSFLGTNAEETKQSGAHIHSLDIEIFCSVDVLRFDGLREEKVARRASKSLFRRVHRDEAMPSQRSVGSVDCKRI